MKTINYSTLHAVKILSPIIFELMLQFTNSEKQCIENFKMENEENISFKSH